MFRLSVFFFQSGDPRPDFVQESEVGFPVEFERIAEETENVQVTVRRFNGADLHMQCSVVRPCRACLQNADFFFIQLKEIPGVDAIPCRQLFPPAVFPL